MSREGEGERRGMTRRRRWGRDEARQASQIITNQINEARSKNQLIKTVSHQSISRVTKEDWRL
jgi:hypothetical protein